MVTGEWCHEVLEDYLLDTYLRKKDETERNGNSGMDKKNSSAYLKKSDKNEYGEVDDNVTEGIKSNDSNIEDDLNSSRSWSDLERFQFQGPGSSPKSLFGGRGVQYHLGFHHTDTCRYILMSIKPLILFFSSFFFFFSFLSHNILYVRFSFV